MYKISRVSAKNQTRCVCKLTKQASSEIYTKNFSGIIYTADKKDGKSHLRPDLHF